MPKKKNHSINWYWRLVATGFAFATFGLGGLFMALTIFPAMMVIFQNQTRRQEYAQFMICRSFRFFIWMLDVTGVAEVTTKDFDRLSTANGVLIIANHPTLIDVVIIMSLLDRCQCVVKHELFSNLFMAGVVRAAGFIRNDGDPYNLIHQASEHLASGACIMMFPEGTRTPNGRKLGPLQRGVANIAIATQADLLPVVVHCNHHTLKKGVSWNRIPPSKVCYCMTVGLPLSIGDFVDSSLIRAKQARVLTRVIKNYFLGRLSNDIT